MRALDHPATPRVEPQVQVMFFDTDCAGVVHNLAYLRHVEVARTLLAEQLGLKLGEMSESGLYPVVVRTEADYKRPMRLGERMVVRGWLDELERSRFWCAFVVERAPDGMVAVECRQLLALVQAPKLKPVRLPVEWMDRYGHLRRPARR